MLLLCAVLFFVHYCTTDMGVAAGRLETGPVHQYLGSFECDTCKHQVVAAAGVNATSVKRITHTHCHAKQLQVNTVKPALQSGVCHPVKQTLTHPTANGLPAFTASSYLGAFVSSSRCQTPCELLPSAVQQQQRHRWEGGEAGLCTATAGTPTSHTLRLRPLLCAAS